jgi:hypothetical protein
MARGANLSVVKYRSCGSGFQPRSLRQDAAPTEKHTTLLGVNLQLKRLEGWEARRLNLSSLLASRLSSRNISLEPLPPRILETLSNSAHRAELLLISAHPVP